MDTVRASSRQERGGVSVCPGSKSYVRDFGRSAGDLKSVLLPLSQSFLRPLAPTSSVARFGFTR